MSADRTNDPAPEAPRPEPAEDAPVRAPGPDRPHGDPVLGDEPGSRHGGTSSDDRPPAGGDAAAGAAASPGAGGADAPPAEPGGEAGDPVEPAGEAGEAGDPVEPGGEAGDPVAAAEARAAEYLNLAQRKQAEFENFRRRMNLQVAQAEDRGVSKLAKELLPALDHLELALQAAEQHAGGEQWVKGIRLVQDEVTGALGRVGIQAYAPVGEPFDPNEHEAMVQAPIEGYEAGTVAQVYQQGYRLNGAVLRPARVVVAQ